MAKNSAVQHKRLNGDDVSMTGRRAVTLAVEKSHFPLVSNGENANFIDRNHKAVQGDVSGLAVGNDQFAQFAFKPPAY